MMDARPLRTLVELAVFVPIGLAAELCRTVPRLVDSGRERMTGRIAVARVIGEMAVKASAEQLRTRTVEEVADPVAPAPPARTPVDVVPVDLSAAAPANADATDESFDSGALPIVGYESLAASQVVARLSALSTVELDQVAQFEQANRRRRTVLGKIDQLQRV